MTELNRILMTADTIGGVWTYAMELCRALGLRGVNVILATMGAMPSETQQREATELANVQLAASDYKLEWMEEPWSDVAASGRWLLELEKRFEPDLVHLNGYAHGTLPWGAPKLIAGHSCVCSWWRAVHGEEAPSEWSRYRSATREGLSAADLVVAPSQFMLNALSDHYGPFKRSVVINNGRQADVTGNFAKEPFILTAGRLWDQAKNVQALRHVSVDLEWPIYVAGHARNHEAREDNERIHYLGVLAPKQLWKWFGRASIYALPARYEPFGLSALEAGLAGCALVLGDIPSLREVWADAALYVDPGSRAALRDALLRLMNSRELLESMSRKARERARLYSSRKMADAYLEAYAAVLAAYAPGMVKGAVTCA